MEYFFPFTAFVFGTVAGSFLNVLIDRLPAGETVIFGRSVCDHCRKPLRAWELVPIFSYLVLGGRCARCRKKLSIQYPVIEALTGILTVFLYLRFGRDPFGFLAVVGIAYTLLVIFMTDIKEQIVPDSMIIVGSLCVLFLRFHLGQGFISGFLSGTVASMLFFLLWLVTRGRGLGFGDVKLVFYLGFLTGFPGVVISLYAAFLTGAFTGVILILTGAKTLKSKVAFGPFLIFGTVIALLYHTAILQWWKGVI